MVSATPKQGPSRWAKRVAGPKGHPPKLGAPCVARRACRSDFFIFLFSFFIKIYFHFRNLQKYTPAAPLPGGRDLAARQGLVCKKKTKKNYRQVPGAGRPAAGRPALPPLYKSWLVPPPLICITTIPETKKKERGRERGEALPDFSMLYK